MQDNLIQDNPANQVLNDQIIGDFLRNDALFFERNAHLLAELYLPSPHGNGAISLAERQQLAQRDKISANEAMMSELIEFAKQNDRINQKVHDLSIALISHRQLDQISTVLKHCMVDAFQVDSASLHCWLPTHNESLAQHPIFAAMPEDFRQWMMSLEQPYCGEKPSHSDFILDASLRSFAFIPLFKTLTNDTHQESMQISPVHLPAIGALILASKDASHFKPEMGTVFLTRIGDLVSAALVNAQE